MYKYLIEYHKSYPDLIPRTVWYPYGTFTWELKLIKLVGLRTQITSNLLVILYEQNKATSINWRD